MKHTALHLAVFGVLAGAALAAQAADVQIYGRVDAGFLYEHKKGEDTFTQKAVHTTESASTSLKISATA